jgi:hypothetical protein
LGEDTMKKFKLMEKPGILVAVIGVLGLTLTFAIQSFTFLERAIMAIVCVVVILGGILAETRFADKFKEQQIEDWN